MTHAHITINIDQCTHPLLSSYQCTPSSLVVPFSNGNGSRSSKQQHIQRCIPLVYPFAS